MDRESQTAEGRILSCLLFKLLIDQFSEVIDLLRMCLICLTTVFFFFFFLPSTVGEH